MRGKHYDIISLISESNIFPTNGGSLPLRTCVFSSQAPWLSPPTAFLAVLV
jgi:hypothetical protein